MRTFIIVAFSYSMLIGNTQQHLFYLLIVNGPFLSAE